MRGLWSAALVVVAALALASGGCPGNGTAECGDTLCNGDCVNLMYDGLNCGSCGNACSAGEHCEGGVCVGACPSGQESCGGFCVNTLQNPSNCGGCGVVCAIDQSCENGSCVGGGDCQPGETDCDGDCVNTNTDPQHCGDCETSCGAGTCSGGTCGSSCDDGLENCSGSCVDTQRDPRNCGSCGNACSESQTCDAGDCVMACVDPERDCDGACVNTNSDPDNCGRCGNFCNDGELCSDGHCVTGGCDAGLTQCGDSCVDTQTDRNHCGDCTTVCPEGEGCLGGDCVTSGCAEGLTECGSECVDTATDLRNCGGCGTECRTDQVCTGSCACPSNREECGGACVDTRVDPENCGGCGTNCYGDACIDGECTVECPEGTVNCDGWCTDTDTDHWNCGGCYIECADDESCLGGTCWAGGGTAGDTCSNAIDVTGGGRFTGSTVAAGADYSASCGGATGRDVVFTYTLSATTDVYINTFDTDFDTLIYVVEEPCGGAGWEQGCNDDARSTLQSELVLLDQPAGTYFIVLDAYSAYGSGDYALDVYFSSPSSVGGDACGEPTWVDIATVDTISGNTCPWYWINSRDDEALSCGYGTGGLDQVFYFVVESTTTVSFTTCGGATWDTKLELRDVCDASWESVACDDDTFDGTCTTQSTIDATTLEPGVYYLWIDGYNDDHCGSFEIAVTRS